MKVHFFKKRIIYVTLMAIILYFTLRPQERHYTLQYVINDSKPMDIWEFVADFSNMKKLIPNMLEFSILAESGNYDHWHYSTYYTEFLQYLPFVHYSNYGHFDVKPQGASFVIQSNHSACFITDLTCVGSLAELQFSQQGSGTLCVESVTYYCPLILSGLCRYEVNSQRKAFAVNLQKHFNKLTVLSNKM